jgi:DNA methylase
VTPLDTILCCDCLGPDGLPALDEHSIDLIVCDLPYGQTRSGWDAPLDLYDLWHEYDRVLAPKGVVALTATMQFALQLIPPATVPFRYELVWRKNKSTGYLNANRQPLRAHELILIFYREQPAYRPQKTTGHRPANAAYTRHNGSTYGRGASAGGSNGQTDRHPTSIITLPVLNNDAPERFHSAQKPVALYEWLIRSYSEPGALVLDNAAGSGTLAEAAIRTDRHYLCMEVDPSLAEKTLDRIALARVSTRRAG